MKITIEHDDHKIVVEDPDVIDICEAIELMEQALIEIGYSEDRVCGAILHRASELSSD